jgi:hypothetical protein
MELRRECVCWSEPTRVRCVSRFGLPLIDDVRARRGEARSFVICLRRARLLDTASAFQLDENLAMLGVSDISHLVIDSVTHVAVFDEAR